MTQTRNRHLAPLAVLAAALIAAGAAYAASRSGGSPSTSGPLAVGYAATPISSNSGRGGHGPGDGGPRGGHGDDLAAAATYLGIPQADLLTSLQSGKTLAQVAGATGGKTVAGLIDAIVAAEKTELAAAVTSGRITQAQADQIATTLTAHVTAEVNNTEPARGPGRGHGGPGHGGDDFTAAATYLGVTEAALSTQLSAGKTLAQVADATGGKSAAGLIDALVAHETAELNAAVTAGSLTAAQRDALLPQLKARFTALANGTRPAHDDHGPRNSTAPKSSTHI
jgi:hypothetical protein